MKKIIQQVNNIKWVSLLISISFLLSPVLLNAQIPTVTIGTQVWMQKNLDVSTYRNGDTIPQVTDPTQWAGLTTGAWCYYINDPANGTIYGKLYNWYAVNDPRGIAPAGWHVPSNEEWFVLTDYLGGLFVAGGKMKETGMLHWVAPNTGATNSSGFTGLPGGVRIENNTWLTNGYYGGWWSTTEYDNGTALEHHLYNDFAEAFWMNYPKINGYSVRCVRNICTAPVITNVCAIPSTLWPPNHKMNAVTVNYTVTGTCTPITTWLTVSSNEPVSGTGNGDVAPDWLILDNHHVQLRAERSGRGNGRIYTITITSTDASGNTFTEKTKVVVPHNNGWHPNDNDGYMDGDGDYHEHMFDCKVMPNPSKQYFSIQVTSSSNEKIEAKLLDENGRLISKLNTVKNQSLRFGDDLRPGVYLVEIKQGEQHKTIKVIKQ